MILIYPPVAKCCEPPAGVALLSGLLKQHNINCSVIDANLDALLWLARKSFYDDNRPELMAIDSWTRRARKNFEQNLHDLRSISIYRNIGRYRQRVMDVNRVISTSVENRYKISLSDYSDQKLSPLKSCDLLFSAQNFGENPFYSYFESSLLPLMEEKFLLCKKRPDFYSGFIGISLCYLSQALTAFALAGWLKATFPEKKIIMGGGLVTSWMSSSEWKSPFKGLIDIMVKGRGEEPLLNLAGIKTKKVQRVLPDFDFCKWDDYIAPGRILPFRAADGCYWGRCRFCPERAEGIPYHAEKSSDLLHDLNLLTEKYGIKHIHFTDDAIAPSLLRKIAGSNGISSTTWYGFARFTKDLADPQFCRKLYLAGCRMLKLGLESGDQSVLDSMEKGTSLKMVSKVLAALDFAGIRTYVYLLFGTAFEDEGSAHKTLDYVSQHSDHISFMNLAIFNLPRFSEDAVELETSMFYGGDLSLYLDFRHPAAWGRRQIRYFLDKKFRKSPGIGEILKKDPPFFTSNHAMFIGLFSGATGNMQDQNV
ncbi:putative methyltransferase [Desulfamplus magnetovallimortis]|uniref:Putative methyltransferase n=1 Tax=Desulfamplus magnetovallimortis TaxID=1246637 RepID=A0A1W1HL34_9BACT|nr:radical SAM protein [Desulfamplus magnetovallimortis]SLM33201.1 putative methyltransferase [Desulfamplus magnetovallimortis]